MSASTDKLCSCLKGLRELNLVIRAHFKLVLGQVPRAALMMVKG